MQSKVLLVDDVADVRLLVRVALRQRDGLEVVAEAGTGHDAVAAARLHQPDIIVCDLGLPDLSATEVIRKLRESSTAKIVVFTGTEVGFNTSFDEPVEGFARKGEDIRFSSTYSTTFTLPGNKRQR